MGPASFLDREVLLTSARANIELIVDRKDEDVKVRDVKGCEAIGAIYAASPASPPPSFANVSFQSGGCHPTAFLYPS